MTFNSGMGVAWLMTGMVIAYIGVQVSSDMAILFAMIALTAATIHFGLSEVDS